MPQTAKDLFIEREVARLRAIVGRVVEKPPVPSNNSKITQDLLSLLKDIEWDKFEEDIETIQDLRDILSRSNNDQVVSLERIQIIMESLLDIAETCKLLNNNNG